MLVWSDIAIFHDLLVRLCTRRRFHCVRSGEFFRVRERIIHSMNYFNDWRLFNTIKFSLPWAWGILQLQDDWYHAMTTMYTDPAERQRFLFFLRDEQ